MIVGAIFGKPPVRKSKKRWHHTKRHNLNDMIEDFEIRKWVAMMDGCEGNRSDTDMIRIKKMLAFLMMDVGKRLHDSNQEGNVDEWMDPNCMAVLRDIDCLLNELIIYDYLQK